MKHLIAAGMAAMFLAYGSLANAASMNSIGADGGFFNWLGKVGTSATFGGDETLVLELLEASLVTFYVIDFADSFEAVGDSFSLVLNGVDTIWDVSGFTGEGIYDGLFEGTATLALGPGTYSFDLTLTAAAPCCAFFGGAFWESNVEPNPVPLPAGLPLLLTGLSALAALRKSKSK